MNISEEGTVPASRETVAINISCSGIADAEVTIYFSFNFSLVPESDMVSQITFSRKKLCHYGKSVIQSFALAYNAREQQPRMKLPHFCVFFSIACAASRYFPTFFFTSTHAKIGN